jgi:hypothetical protein
MIDTFNDGVLPGSTLVFSTINGENFEVAEVETNDGLAKIYLENGVCIKKFDLFRVNYWEPEGAVYIVMTEPVRNGEFATFNFQPS